MVTREELNRSYKIKILLKGPSGTGKTLSCVKFAEYVSNKGFKVLYLDHEKGADDELRKLNDKTLENIIRVGFKDYKEIMSAIKKYTTEEKDKLKLIIIDPMPLIELSRLSARDAFLDQGYYYLGEKKVEIDNKETFDLRGFMYQLATTYQMKLLGEIVNCDQDVVSTLMTPNKNESAYDGKFSIVMEMYTAWVGNQIFYKATPKKNRGVDLNMMPAIDNPYETLLGSFNRKYEPLAKDEVVRKAKEEAEKKAKEKADKKLKEENDRKIQAEIDKRQSK